MKAIINEGFGIYKENILDESLLSKYSIYHKDLGGSIFVMEQKITLTEEDMNELFYGLFCKAEGLRFEYVFLGFGDFCISLTMV